MAGYYPFGRVKYSDYLQASFFVRDITGAIRRVERQTAGAAAAVAHDGAATRTAIAEQTSATLASNEALGREFGRGFDAVNRTLEWGFDVVSQGLDSVRSSIEDLNATFDYSMGLVLAQLQVQNRLTLGVVERLDAIHKTLENPTLTQAREFYRAGSERLERGLLDKALEAFLKSEDKNDTDFLTQLQLGRLYLYGRDADDDIIDIEKARKHLLLSARFGKAETPFLPEASASTGEALLHAAIACYLLASEAKLAGDADASRQRLGESVTLALEAAAIRPALGEAHYQAASGLALLVRPEGVVASLERAIRTDRKYALRAADDPTFASMRGVVRTLLEMLRTEALSRAMEALAAKCDEVDSYIFTGDAGQAVRRALDGQLAEVERMIGRGTMFDCQDALQAVGNIEVKAAAPFSELATLSVGDCPIMAVAFSPDGTILAAGGEGKTVLWVVRKCREPAAITGHSGCVYSVAFSPDSALLAVGLLDATVELWDVDEHKKLGVLKGHSKSVYSVAFSPDGALLASASGDETISLWDVHDQRELAILEDHSDTVRSVAFSADGTLLASAGYDMTVRLWDVHERRGIATLKGHTGLVMSVAFHPDGTLLASGGCDHAVKLWDIRERREAATLKGHYGDVESVAFSPDGTLLASAGSDMTIRLWDVRGRRELAKIGNHSGNVRSVAFHPDGTLLASGCKDKSVRLWNSLPTSVMPRALWEKVQTEMKDRERVASETLARKAREAAEQDKLRKAAEEKLREERLRDRLCLVCGKKLSLLQRFGNAEVCNDCRPKSTN